MMFNGFSEVSITIERLPVRTSGPTRLNICLEPDCCALQRASAFLR